MLKKFICDIIIRPFSYLVVFALAAESLKQGFVSFFFDLRYLVSGYILFLAVWIALNKKIDDYFSISK